jgi:very-short-patch-repair endonuclease
MNMNQRHPNAFCVICGKGFYKRPSKSYSKCCSRECAEQLKYEQGDFSLIPYCKAKGISVDGFIKQIDMMHNKQNKSIKQIAEELGIVRITLMRICKQYGIKTRTVSEDSQRRYSTMTDAEKKLQTQKANKGIRELFKNPQWKEVQIKKVMEAQNFKRSAPELLFEKLMNENGYYPIAQYTEGMAGFLIDFAFPEIKLAIEIDGEYWHSLEKTQKRDRQKNYLLRVKKGWELIRIPASDFTNNSDHYIWEVIQTIETLKVA